ncbi:MAG: SPOR domain-containing protein [Terriglobales bacterium]|jgi:cell division septation protein DedD
MAAPASEDTEITLGTGKMLALFFGLVILCAVFFGMGFSLGKNSVKPMAGDLSPATTATNGSRPSAVKPNNSAAPSQDMTFYKAVGQKDTDAQLTPSSTNPPDASTPPASARSNPAPPDPATSAAPAAGYFVQVAAVSKQEDADALVDALKKKQYPAASASLPTDKLFHVQVGPFTDIKDAESMRSKLLSDGYNPIVKK